MTQATNAGNPPRNKEASLTNLMEKTGYNICQENGQRKYGPPPDWTDAPPPKGSEVFVGKIPRDLYEDELVPVFEKIGKIYEVRLMMDFNGNNRGYAFVTYTCPEDAKKAIKELDNYEIRKGRSIGVCKSVDNCRLFVGGIPKTKTKEEIFEEMRKITDYVADVILYSSISDKSKNRGFAFVEYDSHKAAAMARRKLMPGKIQLWGHDVAVDWAEPEIEVDEDTMSKVTVLYVRNLMQNTTEDRIREVFSMDNALKIEKVKKLRDFAFVHYSKREDAEKALAQLNNKDLEGSVIEVTWAKPVDRSTRPRNNRPVSSSTVPTYNPFIYGPITMDPYSGHMTFPPCAARGPMLQRVPIARRGRGAAGIRRFRNYGSVTNRTVTYKPVDVPLATLPPPYSHQYQTGKLGRVPEEGKPFHQTEYSSVYLPAPTTADGLEPTMTSIPPPGLAPYAAHPRIGPPGYLPVIAAFDESGYYPYLPAPGAVSMY